jgi:hypothetical protein
MYSMGIPMVQPLFQEEQDEQKKAINPRPPFSTSINWLTSSGAFSVGIFGRR